MPARTDAQRRAAHEFLSLNMDPPKPFPNNQESGWGVTEKGLMALGLLESAKSKTKRLPVITLPE